MPLRSLAPDQNPTWDCSGPANYKGFAWSAPWGNLSSSHQPWCTATSLQFSRGSCSQGLRAPKASHPYPHICIPVAQAPPFRGLFLNVQKQLHSSAVEVLFFFSLNEFIYLFLAALGVRYCARAFSSCGERGLLFLAVCRLLIAVASLCCKAWALGARASVVVARGI